MMIPIRIECECGQPYVFEIEPVNGQMPSTVACPTCGKDGTAAANQVIAKTLAPQTQPAPSPTSASPPEGLVNLDFVQTFPHIFWVSTIGTDEKSPEGYRYKILTMRREPEMTVEFILLRETVSGYKTTIAHKRGPLNTFGAIPGIVQQLGKDKGVAFEQFDFSNIRSFAEFQSRTIQSGWESFHAA